jgi:hypothetical protein
MPSITQTGHTITVGVTPGQIIITSENRNLQAVALRPCTDSAVPLLNSPSHAFGMIYIASVATPAPVPRILLVSGYFGYYVNISWNGNIRLEPSDCIFALFYSQLACAAELTVRTEME